MKHLIILLLISPILAQARMIEYDDFKLFEKNNLLYFSNSERTLKVKIQNCNKKTIDHIFNFFDEENLKSKIKIPISTIQFKKDNKIVSTKVTSKVYWYLQNISAIVDNIFTGARLKCKNS